jgi:branched-chain amino acid transport system substrate-binding protein
MGSTLKIPDREGRRNRALRSNLPWFSKNVAAMGAVALSVGVLAACSGSSTSTGSTTGAITSSGPITIGASLSLTGGFQFDGVAFERGYELWQQDVNAAGGILGRQVDLKILNDNSSPNQVVTNYQTLINTDHVDLVLGPYSSLLTAPASAVAATNGYAFVEGAGGAPSVFDTPSSQADHNVFDATAPVADEMMPFVQYIENLPASVRHNLTAAYPEAIDPFADPPVTLTRQKLQALGIKTVYAQTFPENGQYTTPANQVAAARPNIVVLGSTDVGTVQAFMSALEQQRYTPKMFIAQGGPDQGASFIKAVGAGNATGVMVPNGWYPGFKNTESQKMVNEYEAKYHVGPSAVNADVAEAYAAAQVLQQAIIATAGTNNAAIIKFLHTGVTLHSVEGPVQFNSLGENGAAKTFIFQWQKGANFVQVLPAGNGSQSILANKPKWATTG